MDREAARLRADALGRRHSQVLLRTVLGGWAQQAGQGKELLRLGEEHAARRSRVRLAAALGRWSDLALYGKQLQRLQQMVAKRRQRAALAACLTGWWAAATRRRRNRAVVARRLQQRAAATSAMVLAGWQDVARKSVLAARYRRKAELRRRGPSAVLLRQARCRPAPIQETLCAPFCFDCRCEALMQRWLGYARHKRWCARLVSGRDAARRRALLGGCWAAWLDAVAAARQDRAERASRGLQRQIAELEAAAKDMTGLLAAERARGDAITSHLARMHSRFGWVAGRPEDALLGPTLQYRLARHADGLLGLPRRERHVSAYLQAPRGSHVGAEVRHVVQRREAGASVCTYEVVSPLDGFLVSFGGVDGQRWLSDTHAVAHRPCHVLRVTCTMREVGTAAEAEVESVEVEEGPSSTWQPTPLPVLGAQPPPRRDFGGCPLGGEGLCVVGGWDGRNELADVYTCHLSTENGGGALVWRRHEPRNSAPPPRSYPAVAHDPVNGSLVIFGGYSAERSCPLNDVWVYHLDHATWACPEVQGAPPSPRRVRPQCLRPAAFLARIGWKRECPPVAAGCRRGCAMAVVGRTLVLHGGSGAEGPLGDTWVLDLDTWQWREVPNTGGPCPVPRKQHAALSVGTCLVVHGGYDGQRYLGDLWCLDLADLSRGWRALPTAPAHGEDREVPVGRSCHTLTLVGQSLALVGGVTRGTNCPGLLHLLDNPCVSAGLAAMERTR